MTLVQKLERGFQHVEAVQAQNTRAQCSHTYHLVIAFHPNDRRLEPMEPEHIVEKLVDTLGYSEPQCGREHIQADLVSQSAPWPTCSPNASAVFTG